MVLNGEVHPGDTVDLDFDKQKGELVFQKQVLVN
jgi:hypothetical protein